MNNPHRTGDNPMIQQNLHAMLACRLGRRQHEITDSCHLVNELYVDSLDLVEIEIGVAETFDVELTESDLLSMETVGDLRAIVCEKIGHAEE